MLDHVALGQTRFKTPGVGPDTRGVLIGREGLVVFSSLDAVVSWLRLYSAEFALDEFSKELHIYQVSTPLKSQEFVMRLRVQSSRSMDGMSRMAALVGASSYTGTSKHFVKYRDPLSPYGYDISEIAKAGEGTDVVVYDQDFVQSFSIKREIEISDLLMRLSLQREAQAEHIDSDLPQALLVVELGLAKGIIRYLSNASVLAQAGIVTSPNAQHFGRSAQHKRTMLFRIPSLPKRMVQLFRTTPGIDVFQMKAEQVAVEVGYRHVVDLSHSRQTFKGDGLWLFRGKEDRVECINGPIELSNLADLAHVAIEIKQAAVFNHVGVEHPECIAVHIQLVPSVSVPKRVNACFIPRERHPWLKKMVFALPPSVLRLHRIVVSEQGTLVVSDAAHFSFPLGHRMSELAPGLFIPIGMELAPRVQPNYLAEALGHGERMLTIFSPEGIAFRLSALDLQPLERQTIAAIEIERAELVDTVISPTNSPELVNDPIGRFALWGFKAPNE